MTRGWCQHVIWAIPGHRLTVRQTCGSQRPVLARLGSGSGSRTTPGMAPLSPCRLLQNPLRLHRPHGVWDNGPETGPTSPRLHKAALPRSKAFPHPRCRGSRRCVSGAKRFVLRARHGSSPSLTASLEMPAPRLTVTVRRGAAWGGTRRGSPAMGQTRGMPFNQRSAAERCTLMRPAPKAPTGWWLSTNSDAPDAWVHKPSAAS